MDDRSRFRSREPHELRDVSESRYSQLLGQGYPAS